MPDRNRERVLELIRGRVGNRPEEGKVNGRMTFCPRCGMDISSGNARPGQGIRCLDSACGYVGDRAFIFDPQTLWLFNRGEYPSVPPGELLHFAVGAVIRRADRYLLIRRKLYPAGIYVIPAGHLEPAEPQERAMIKEVREETGLAVATCSLLMDKQVLPDSCRRSVDHHVWSLYACECTGDVAMNCEADQIGWYTAQELRKLPLGGVTRRLLLPIADL